MEHSIELAIDPPRVRVVELFDNANNRPKRRENLRSFEHVSGEPGQPGAKF